MLLTEQKKLVLMALLWNWILGWFGWNAFAQVQPDCDFQYYLEYGQSNVLQNPGFDQGMYYEPNKVCRWVYNSPKGTVFDLTCNPLDIPSLYNGQCPQDRLVVSLTGDKALSDGRSYCGQGTLKLTSTTNALSIGLVSASYSNGGRYRCIITPIGGGNVPPPTSPPTTSTTKSPITNCDCGWKQQRRIVGGVETKVNEYAFMAAIIDIGKRTVWCGASIISDRYALTAAHCVVDRSPTQFGLLVGDHNLKEGSETTSAALYNLIDFIVHELYNSESMANDIAVVQTSNQIAISMNVGPVCLPFRYTSINFTNAPVTTMGWGTLFFTGPTSDALRAVNLTVKSNVVCQSSYDRRTILNSEICTYGEGKDACQFDSGGPVVWYDNFNTYRFQLLGIVSFGNDCGSSSPGVNTRVTSFLSWILNVTPGATYCSP